MLSRKSSESNQSQHPQFSVPKKKKQAWLYLTISSPACRLCPLAWPDSSASLCSHSAGTGRRNLGRRKQLHRLQSSPRAAPGRRELHSPHLLYTRHIHTHQNTHTPTYIMSWRLDFRQWILESISECFFLGLGLYMLALCGSVLWLLLLLPSIRKSTIM